MEKREYQLNNKTYQILTPPVRVSMPLCNRVAVLIAPALTSLGMDIAKGGKEAFASAISSCDPIAIDELFMDSIKAAKLHCAGMPVYDPVPFDQHFEKNKGDVYPVCVWVIWECVKDFFPQLGVFIPKMKEEAEKAFQSQMDGQPIGG